MTDAPEYCGPHTAQEALDETERRLLDIIQTAFPLTPRPYADLGTLLGIPEEEALERVRSLRERRFTLISPSREDERATLADITARTGIPILNLPATRLFKIRVDFRMQD